MALRALHHGTGIESALLALSGIRVSVGHALHVPGALAANEAAADRRDAEAWRSQPDQGQSQHPAWGVASRGETLAEPQVPSVAENPACGRRSGTVDSPR